MGVSRVGSAPVRMHLIGIGGTGMGALAGLLKAAGHEVRGSDGPIYPPMSEQLASLQIEVAEGYAGKNLDWAPDLVVVGNTCKKNNPEVIAAQERELPLASLPSVLGERMLLGKHAIVIAGTHGKTTTSSLMSHLLIRADRDPSVFVGGVLQDLGRGWRLGEGPEFVLEGDEYDSAFFDKGSKFLHYQPQTAVVTSVELDHVDIFASFDAIVDTFRSFVSLIPETGLLLLAQSSEDALQLAKDCKGKVQVYGVVGQDELNAAIAWQAVYTDDLPSGRSTFTVYHLGQFFGKYEMMMSGKHNVENALACIAISYSRGLSQAQIRKGISTFSGVARRQQFRGLAQGVTVLEDYGHHPTAIGLTLSGLRRRFPKKRLVAIYEPRTATSRRQTFQAEYVRAFIDADELIVGALHCPQNIPKEEQFDPFQLARDVHQYGTSATCLEEPEQIIKHALHCLRPGDVVVVFSTGAFHNVIPRLIQALGDGIVPARPKHLRGVCQLLKELELSCQDVDNARMSEFYVLENEEGLVGCIGLEVFEKDAVLHSLAVSPKARGIGYGWMLADMAIWQAKLRGVRHLYLITAKASEFFAVKHGFRIIDLSTAPESIMESTTFHLCGDSLIPMRLDL